jgi:hypothetical protein
LRLPAPIAKDGAQRMPWLRNAASMNSDLLALKPKAMGCALL